MSAKYSSRPADLLLLRGYAERAEIDVEKERLTDSEGKKIFELIVSDYKSGKLSVDDLSILCELMYAKFSLDSDLHSLLLNGAGIEWDIRHEPEAAANTISEIFDFFENN